MLETHEDVVLIPKLGSHLSRTDAAATTRGRSFAVEANVLFFSKRVLYILVAAAVSAAKRTLSAATEGRFLQATVEQGVFAAIHDAPLLAHDCFGRRPRGGC